MNETVDIIAKAIGVAPEKIQPVRDVFDIKWHHGFVPVVAPKEDEEALRSLQDHFGHPHANIFPPTTGNYEALRSFDKGALLLYAPWLKEALADKAISRAFAFENFLVREIEPNPTATEDPLRYTFGFSQDTGRSVDYPVKIERKGATWYHLNAVGVGKTLKARQGAESRDGKLPLRGALRRYYYSNLMHAIAGPCRFRTSLAVALVNRNQARVANPKQIEATLYELRREQLRLRDLSNHTNVRNAIDQVKAKIAKELGKDSITDEEYVRWFAQTLGEQFAILSFFNLDHGEYNGEPQLHAMNVSLAAEIFDFDTARFHPGARYRYISNSKKRTAVDYIDLERIRELERAIKKEESHNSWLDVFLKLSPNIDFYPVLLEAKRKKMAELRKSGINPVAEIERFKREVWRPFVRGKLRISSQALRKAS